jgi:pimeloyl-ACP methyl ester carboxylesterase
MRIAVEDYIRGVGDRATAQELVDMAASRPWFPLASVRRDLPQRPHTWQDMDFEPEPVFAKVACPVLAFYGETDEWVPIEESIAAWQRAFTAASNQDLTVHRLQGCDHTPTIGHSNDIDGISDDYTKTLTAWIERHKQASGT